MEVMEVIKVFSVLQRAMINALELLWILTLLFFDESLRLFRISR